MNIAKLNRHFQKPSACDQRAAVCLDLYWEMLGFAILSAVNSPLKISALEAKFRAEIVQKGFPPRSNLWLLVPCFQILQSHEDFTGF